MASQIANIVKKEFVRASAEDTGTSVKITLTHDYYTSSNVKERASTYCDLRYTIKGDCANFKITLEALNDLIGLFNENS